MNLNTLIEILHALRDEHGGATLVTVVDDLGPNGFRVSVEKAEPTWPGFGLGGPVVMIDISSKPE